MQITGADGADLHARWKEGARAFLGLCMPDFPNLFVVYGPNTNLGGSSIINMLEAAAGAITTLLRHTEQRRRPVGRRTPRGRGALRRGDPAAASGTACGRRCHNWYHQDGGRISTNWPGLVKEYQQRCADLDLRRLRRRLSSADWRSARRAAGPARARAGPSCRRERSSTRSWPRSAASRRAPVQRLDGGARQPASRQRGRRPPDPRPRGVVERPRRSSTRERSSGPASCSRAPVARHRERLVAGPLGSPPAAVATPVSMRAGRLRVDADRGDGAVARRRCTTQSVDHASHHRQPPASAPAGLEAPAQRPLSAKRISRSPVSSRRGVDGQPTGDRAGARRRARRRCVTSSSTACCTTMWSRSRTRIVSSHVGQRVEDARVRRPSSAGRSRCSGAGGSVTSATSTAMSSAYPVRPVVSSRAPARRPGRRGPVSPGPSARGGVGRDLAELDGAVGQAAARARQDAVGVEDHEVAAVDVVLGHRHLARWSPAARLRCGAGSATGRRPGVRRGVAGVRPCSTPAARWRCPAPPRRTWPRAPPGPAPRTRSSATIALSQVRRRSMSRSCTTARSWPMHGRGGDAVPDHVADHQGDAPVGRARRRRTSPRRPTPRPARAGSDRRSRPPEAPAATRAAARPASRSRRRSMLRRGRRARVWSVTSTPWASTPRTEPSSANQGLTVTSQKTSNGLVVLPLHLDAAGRSW